ncbi:MAG TPA: DUF488 family protein [Paracoccus sp.]|nr:DUF488 family protein [Paracoccus sp. (in: a-proteobacteria)]
MSRTLHFPIRLGRVYDPIGAQAGARLLADRLWPRGLSKDALELAAWVKEATPSDALRRWYHAGPEARRAEFRQRYRAELEGGAGADAACLDWCRRGPVLLLSAARDPETSHLPVLRAHLIARLSEAAGA